MVNLFDLNECKTRMEEIMYKRFKKKFFGGYDELEVDSLKETIILDYQFIKSNNEIIYNKLKLSVEKVSSKSFTKKTFGGYDEDDVDVFLDTVTSDYGYCMTIQEYLQSTNELSAQ